MVNHMPYWKQDEEQALIHLVQEGADIDTMAEQLNRSPEAVRLKIRRLGFMIPECKKEVGSTTTLEPIKPVEGLISVEEAAKMALGSIQRLNEKGLTVLDVKRIRLILSGLKQYIVLYSEYVERIGEVEERIEKLNKVVLSQLEEKVAKAASDSERQFWQQKLKEFTEKTAVDKPFAIWKRRTVKRDVGPIAGRR